jgi:hypothetical protein
MDGQIDPAGNQGIVDLLGEKRSAADPRERNVLRQIAGRPNLHLLGGISGGPKQSANPVRLPQC